MKLKKYCVVLLICLAIGLATGQDFNLLEAVVLPVANMGLAALAIPPPLGPCLATGLGLLQTACHIFSAGSTAAKDDVKQAEIASAISKVNLLKIQTKLENAIKNIATVVINQADGIIKELSFKMESHGLLTKMRTTLSHLADLYASNIRMILDNKITGLDKNLTIIELHKADGYSRRKMRSFVDNFIKPNYDFNPSGSKTKMFYEYLLERDNMMADKGIDNRLNSIHSSVFQSFMYIAKTLTESYVLVLLTYVIQYQKEIAEGNFSDAEGTKYSSEAIINEYKKSMKTLIEKTKWALDSSSREIRNSEMFVPEQGKTFDRVSFASILPKIWNMVETDVFYYKCIEDQRYVNFNDYEIGECSGYIDDIPFTSRLQIALSPNDRNRPFGYMKFTKPDGTEEVFGHNNSQPFSIMVPTRTFQQCYTVFCPAFKKNAFAISTQRVIAKLGYVITGLRFKVRKNVLYIDIQQGKFIDPISVDETTVEWTETPESNEIIYLNSNTRKIELGNFELSNHLFLTGIQLKESFLRRGVIKIFIYGSSSTNWAKSSVPISFEDKVLELYELNLSGSDDPEKADVNLRKTISKPPVENKPYSVSFQATDLKKDFGRTTCPMIDIREVASSPSAPLSGFGIILERPEGTCGYLALKLIAYQLSGLIDYKMIEQFADTSMKIDVKL